MLHSFTICLDISFRLSIFGRVPEMHTYNYLVELQVIIFGWKSVVISYLQKIHLLISFLIGVSFKLCILTFDDFWAIQYNTETNNSSIKKSLIWKLIIIINLWKNLRFLKTHNVLSYSTIHFNLNITHREIYFDPHWAIFRRVPI